MFWNKPKEPQETKPWRCLYGCHNNFKHKPESCARIKKLEYTLEMICGQSYQHIVSVEFWPDCKP